MMINKIITDKNMKFIMKDNNKMINNMTMKIMKMRMMNIIIKTKIIILMKINQIHN